MRIILDTFIIQMWANVKYFPNVLLKKKVDFLAKPNFSTFDYPFSFRHYLGHGLYTAFAGLLYEHSHVKEVPFTVGVQTS